MPGQARQQPMATGIKLKAKSAFANNSERIARSSRAGTLPYFVRDNYKVGKDGTLTPTFASKAQDQYIRRGKKQEQEVFQYRKKEATQEQQAREPALVASSGSSIGAKANVFNNFTDKLKGFQDYDTGKFEQTYNNPNSKGYVVRDKGRIAHGSINKQERYKLDKETRMAKVFADGGFKIELIEEKTRESSHDAFVNGIKAEFKSVSSPKQIVRHAKKATREQGAEVVLFEFEKESKELFAELESLKKLGIKAMYYFKGKWTIHKLWE